MLYPTECDDPSNSQVDKPTSVAETENSDDDDEDHNYMDENLDLESLETISRPT